MLYPYKFDPEDALNQIQNKIFDFTNNYPLGYEHAMIYGSDKDVINIIQRGADINALGVRGSSYLWMCIVHSEYERCLFLMQLGADPDSDPIFRSDVQSTIERYETYDWAEKEVNLLYNIREFLNKYDMSIKIQKTFRMYMAKSLVHNKRLEPDFLFEPLYTNTRKCKYNIDDSRFKN